MAEFKVGQTVYAAKAAEQGRDHEFGFNDHMKHFAKGDISGVIVEIYSPDSDCVEYSVRTEEGGTWSYAAEELRKTPRLPRVSKAAIRTKKVLAKAPKKVYAVVKGGSVYPTANRQDARDLKLILGGKAKGAIIVRYDITAEIR